ncbi:ABC transporter permease [uncultured Hyphomonas sp.]|uniref:ABC transporter permease n=1 Tax=uncultured Hyphomonas sp. TaxID=225298 RepID=UPI002AAC486D|nr:ABC transporter permease [uncultured Hyphomonas sp.]
MQHAAALNKRSGGNIVSVCWNNRALIGRLARREIEGRYRGSMFGLLWAVFTPILMVCTYAFVFTYIFRPRWEVQEGVEANFVLLLYSGFLIYGVFAETVGRAPGLIMENVSYVKKVVFPLEILPVVTLMSALINLCIGTVILLILYTVMYGLPGPLALLLPFTILPVVLFSVGLSWILSALGVYLRDLGHVVMVLVQMLMFLSPIFFPITAIPEQVRPILKASPLTPALEASKDVLFWRTMPDLIPFGIAVAVSAIIAVIGFEVFKWLRSGFADVV